MLVFMGDNSLFEGTELFRNLKVVLKIIEIAVIPDLEIGMSEPRIQIQERKVKKFTFEFTVPIQRDDKKYQITWFLIDRK